MQTAHVPAVLVDISFQFSDEEEVVLYLQWDMYMMGSSELELSLSQVAAFVDMAGVPLDEFLEDPTVILASAWYVVWMDEAQGWWFRPEVRN